MNEICRGTWMNAVMELGSFQIPASNVSFTAQDVKYTQNSQEGNKDRLVLC